VGQKKRKTAAFIERHPVCCFCGQADAETIDHVPNRACFVGREYPEEFEFPACNSCNSATREADHVFGFYVRCLDQDGSTYRQDEFQRLISGMRNNYPEALPNADLTANQVRRGLRHRGDVLPQGMLLSDVPLVGVPTSFDGYASTSAAKLTRALYYREMGVIAPASHFVMTRWFDFASPKAPEAIAAFAAIFPRLTVGRRTNTDIGLQFLYRWDQGADGEVFGFIAQFSRAILILGVAASPTASDIGKMGASDAWRIDPRSGVA
jgi:hypothetical protein